MICSEPILHVYEKFAKNSEEEEGFVTMVGKLAFYTTGNCSLILITGSCFIEISAWDVQVYEKGAGITPSEFFTDKWVLQESCEELQYLFAGERVCAIKRDESSYAVLLDDFALPVIRFINEDNSMGDYGQQEEVILGFDRYLTRNCECGGAGKIWLDQLDDYMVRCEACHKATYAHMALKNAIAAWNKRDVPCNIDFTFEELDKYLTSTIHGIMISKYAGLATDQSYRFPAAVLTTGYGMLLIEWRHVFNEESTFSFTGIGCFNREGYPWNIVSRPGEQITYVEKLYHKNGVLRGIKFQYGARYLFLYASSRCLTLTKSMTGLENIASPKG